MKKTVLLFFCLFFLSNVFSQAPSSLFEEANQAYTDGRYEEAIAGYLSVLDTEDASSVVYYNLGNSYYRTNQIALSILSYERALKLSPSDEDVLFNLKMAQRHCVDNIQGIEEFFLWKWIHDLASLFSATGWSWISIITFICALLACSLFLYSTVLVKKKLGFLFAFLFFSFSLSAYLLANSRSVFASEQNMAIVTSPAILVKSSPDLQSTDLFSLHAGTKIEVKSTFDDWVEIKLADGNVGWIKKIDMEII